MTPHLLLSLLEDGNEIHARVIDGLPSDARFVSWGHDPTRQDLLCIVVESSEWEYMPPGLFLPVVCPLVETIPKKGEFSYESTNH